MGASGSLLIATIVWIKKKNTFSTREQESKAQTVWMLSVDVFCSARSTERMIVQFIKIQFIRLESRILQKCDVLWQLHNLWRRLISSVFITAMLQMEHFVLFSMWENTSSSCNCNDITLLSFIPARCWMAPEIPTAMYNSCGHERKTIRHVLLACIHDV